MSDEGEESDSAVLAQLPGSPSPHLLSGPHRPPSPPQPPDLSSSTPALRGPAPVPQDRLRRSPERFHPCDSPRFTPPKFTAKRLTDTGSQFRQRQNARLAAAERRCDAPASKRGGDATSHRAGPFQDRGQRLPRVQDRPDHGNHCLDQLLDPGRGGESQTP